MYSVRSNQSPLTECRITTQLDSPLCDPQENASYLSMSPSLQFSLYSSVGVLVEDDTLCVLFLMQWANTEWLQRMLLPSWERWCTCVPLRRVCMAESLQCLGLSTFFYASWLSFPSSKTQALSVSTLCLHVRMCQHAHVHVVSLRAQETLLVLTRRILQQCHVSLSFSDSRLCYLQVVCPAPDCTSVAVFFVFVVFLGWHSLLLFVYKVFVSSQRESGLHIAFGEGVIQRCQRAQ